MTIEAITKEASQLPAEEKFRLVDILLAQLDPPTEQHLTTWAHEVNARHEAYLAGKLESYSHDEVMERLRRK